MTNETALEADSISRELRSFINNLPPADATLRGWKMPGEGRLWGAEAMRMHATACVQLAAELAVSKGSLWHRQLRLAYGVATDQQLIAAQQEKIDDLESKVRAQEKVLAVLRERRYPSENPNLTVRDSQILALATGGGLSASPNLAVIDFARKVLAHFGNRHSATVLSKSTQAVLDTLAETKQAQETEGAIVNALFEAQKSLLEASNLAERSWKYCWALERAAALVLLHLEETLGTEEK